jgi:hypothetical protein
MSNEYEPYELDGKMLSPSNIKSDIGEDMKLKAFELAFKALNMYNIEKDIADYIKENYDLEFEKSWQCVVGIYYMI